MPNTDLHGALKIAESARVGIEQLKIPNKASSVSSSPFITLSLGVSTMVPTQSLSPDVLIKDADNALYAAKNSGRNKTLSSQSIQEKLR